MRSFVNRLYKLCPNSSSMPAYWKTLTPKYLKKDIERGLDVNKTDEYGKTPLFWISKGFDPDPEVIKMLIEHGADVNAKDYMGRTALMWASANNSTEVIKTLIEHGADVDAKDEYRWTALMWACENTNNPDIITVLVENGSDIKAEGRGTYPLLWNKPSVLSLAMDNKNPAILNRIRYYRIQSN